MSRSLVFFAVLAAGCERETATAEWTSHLFGVAVQDILLHGEDVWLATDEGLILIRDNDTTIFSKTNSPVLSYNILTVEADPQNRIWFGDGNQGLVIYDGVHWLRMTTANSPLPVNGVNDIVFDDSLTWLACGQQLVCMAPLDTTIFNGENSPLPASPIVALSLRAPGELWLATFGGGVVRKKGSQWTVFTTANSSLRNNSVFDVTHSEDGVTWVGEGGGLNKFDGQQWTNFNSLDSPLPQNDVTALTIASGNVIWLGMYEGGVARIDGQRWTGFDPENSAIPSMRVLSIQAERRGVWVGTPLGLAVYR